MKTNSMKTKSIVMVGMFAAILAVLSQIALPLPSGVPVTLQTFAVALAAYVLGWKLGTMSVLIYVLLGAAGVPVFAGLSGGPGILLGKTGGFIFGFILMALLCGFGEKKKSNIIKFSLSGVGLIFCHLLGVLQFSFLSNTTLIQSALLVSVPYLIKDVISIAAAYMVGLVVKKALYAADILQYAKEA